MKLPLLKKKKKENIPKKKLTSKIRSKIKEYHRVLKITKKPSMQEFKTAVKVTGIGIIIIGIIGFTISIIAYLIK